MKACVVFMALFLAGAKGLLAASSELVSSSAQMLPSGTSMFSRSAPAPPARAYRLTLLDSALYTSILAYRTMDFLSSQQCLHSLYCGEGELPQYVVATKPGFVAFEAGMATGEIGSSLWLHRHGHGKVARAVDLFSIATGTWGIVHNYRLPKYD